MRHSFRDPKTGKFVSNRREIKIMCGTAAAEEFERIFKEELKNVDMTNKKGYRLKYL